MCDRRGGGPMFNVSYGYRYATGSERTLWMHFAIYEYVETFQRKSSPPSSRLPYGARKDALESEKPARELAHKHFNVTTRQIQRAIEGHKRQTRGWDRYRPSTGKT
jgi:hypothetical protein